MLTAAQSPLYDGCENFSQLSTSLHALSLKNDHNLSESCFNHWVEFMSDTMPNDNHMLRNFYQSKKSVAQLGLGCVKIDCCLNGCMLYYKDDDNLESCRYCGEQRYKCIIKRGNMRKRAFKKMWYFPLVPRLQRLYSSMQTTTKMR